MSSLFKRAKENYIRNEKYIRNEQKSQQTGESLKIAKGIALDGSINLFELRQLDFQQVAFPIEALCSGLERCSIATQS
jgi:hypothetical protein